MSANNSFNIKAWTTALPSGRTTETSEANVEAALKFHPDSIHSRPAHYVSKGEGPGAPYKSDFGRNINGTRKVVKHSSNAVRGSIEGPPFVGKTYEIVLQNFMGPSRDDDGESHGVYKCVAKDGPVTTMVNVKTGDKITLGKKATPKNNWQSRFWYQNGLQSWVFEEVKAGGARVKKIVRQTRKKTSNK
jgi:hypothetical protein